MRAKSSFAFDNIALFLRLKFEIFVQEVMRRLNIPEHLDMAAQYIRTG